MPEETAPAPVEGGQATSPEPSGVDFTPVLDRVGELASNLGNIGARLDSFEQRLPQPEQPEEPDPWAALFPEQPQVDAYQQVDQFGQPVQPQQPQPQLDPQALQTAFQQANAPLQQEIAQLRLERAREQLHQQIPALKDPQVADDTAKAMIAAYQAAGQPRETIQAALNNPFLISQFFKAAEAEKLAAGQAPTGEQVPQLEAAGGATPGGGEPPDPIRQLHEGHWELPKGLR